MKHNLTQKILGSHLVSGNLEPGSEIAIRIDQTLLQDATGTMAMLEFESLGLDTVRVPLATQYVDHNLLQTDSKNADDHAYLRTACARYGIHYSLPGNGISHQVHSERFGAPGKTLLGADSHTPAGAAVSMLAIGAGGLDIALAMAGEPYYLPCPSVLGVYVVGELPPWVGAKDLVLELLRRYNVKGCVGKVIEYHGPGVRNLSAADRRAIGNMGTELGATSSVFPSDDRTRAYLEAEGRGDAWIPLEADAGCVYDERVEVDLRKLEPLIALPSSPGNVVPVRDVAGTPVHQVIVGSSANSSYEDLMLVAEVVRGRHADPDVSFEVNPGSRQVIENVAERGGLVALLQAGARVHQSGCLGCIGMGQAPGTGQVSLRTFPRNFPGRSGTADDRVHLCSPQTAVAAALTGRITDPRDLGGEIQCPAITLPDRFTVDASSIIAPSPEGRSVAILRGPNIKPFPQFEPLPDALDVDVALKVGDNVSTDEIMPAGNRVLPLRSNIPAISRHVFEAIDSEFPDRCDRAGDVAVIGGENYGQGSSREHAAIAPRFLGVRVKIAKSFARIHKANLINFGVLPLTFKDPRHYEAVSQGDSLSFPDLAERVRAGDDEIPVRMGGKEFFTLLNVSQRQRRDLLAGGRLNRVRAAMREDSR